MYLTYIVCLVAKLYLTLLQPQGLSPARLLCPRDFPGRNEYGAGSCFLLQYFTPVAHVSWDAKFHKYPLRIGIYS